MISYIFLKITNSPKTGLKGMEPLEGTLQTFPSTSWTKVYKTKVFHKTQNRIKISLWRELHPRPAAY